MELGWGLGLSIAFIIFVYILALVGTILSFVFITPEKRKLPKFFSLIRDLFNFKYLILEKVLKALYIFWSLYYVLYGFFLLFAGFRTTYNYDSWYGYGEESVEYYGYWGLLVMILGPIIVRIGYELVMLLVLLVKNTMEINKKLSGKTKAEAKAAPAPTAPKAAPAVAPATAPAQPSEDTALIAAITAAVAAYLDQPTTSFRVVSFKRTGKKK